MLRIASRALVTTITLACLLGVTTPAAAQKVKSSRQASRPRPVRVTSPRPQARTPTRSTVRVTRPSTPRVRTTRPSTPSVRVTRPSTRSVRVTRPSTRTSVRATRPSTPTSVRVRQASSQAVKARSTAQSPSPVVRVNRAPAVRGGTTSSAASRFRGSGVKVSDAGSNTRAVTRETVSTRFRTRTTPRYRYDGYRDYRRRPNDRRGYYYGYNRGYYRGYNRGFVHGRYYGYCFGSCYARYHYYGPHMVFGWHYGGFGFWNGFWHFAIVIGDPVLVPYHLYHYRYSWWNGRPATLVTWERAVEAYPADYSFEAAGCTCVELWLRTTDGTDYKIQVDPAYWSARDPGELYAALWTELQETGKLQIEDIHGAVHVFPAGMIQEIEARACR